MEVICMCMFSVTAENSRDARQGEDLVVSQASHGCSNWLTQAGKPGIAVCVPHTAVLAVQLPKQAVRGATFEQAKQPDKNGRQDFLNYLDGKKERVALDDLPKRTKIRVLHLFANVGPTPMNSGGDRFRGERWRGSGRISSRWPERRQPAQSPDEVLRQRLSRRHPAKHTSSIHRTTKRAPMQEPSIF